MSNIRSIDIENLINQHIKTQAAQYANLQPNSANSTDRFRSGDIVQIGVVFPNANDIRSFPYGPSDIVDPGKDVLGTTAVNPPNALATAIYKWCDYYSKVRLCHFQQTVTNDGSQEAIVVGPTIASYDKIGYIPSVASNALTSSGISVDDIANSGNMIKGYDIVLTDIESAILFLKQQLKGIYEDPSKGTTFSFCHSSCHSNCHSSRSRR